VTFSNGNLFGTTYRGGAFGSDATLGGTVFEPSPTNRGRNETLLYSFTGRSDGSNPVTGVARNQRGNLYGITGGGGLGVGECTRYLLSNTLKKNNRSSQHFAGLVPHVGRQPWRIPIRLPGGKALPVSLPNTRVRPRWTAPASEAKGHACTIERIER